jgi:hypothetical protein
VLMSAQLCAPLRVDRAVMQRRPRFRTSVRKQLRLSINQSNDHYRAGDRPTERGCPSCPSQRPLARSARLRHLRKYRYGDNPSSITAMSMGFGSFVESASRSPHTLATADTSRSFTRQPPHHNTLWPMTKFDRMVDYVTTTGRQVSASGAIAPIATAPVPRKASQ